MSNRILVLALGALAGAGAMATAAGERPLHRPAPAGLVAVPTGTETLTLWPYTTSDFENPSDPINLVFPGADPRGIRQELLKVDGARPPFASVPGGDCRWTDAMGDELAAYGRPAGWVGGVVQLACVHPGTPLGDPFRFHLRLFRTGRDTIGNAHLDFLIPGTAEHEALSWDLARDVVAYDLGRTGALTAARQEVAVLAPGTFRAVRRPVYDGLVAFGGGVLVPFLEALGLVPSGAGEVPIPTSGEAVVLAAAVDFQTERTTAVTTFRLTYGIVVPKPFCASGPYDFVKLEGPLEFVQSVDTDPSGRYERTYTLGGTLRATPMVPTSPTTFVPAGETRDAPIFELHRAFLTDHHGETRERAERSLHGDVLQSLVFTIMAGDVDRYRSEVTCGGE